MDSQFCRTTRIFADDRAIADFLADHCETLARQAIHEKNIFTAALPGGSTPREFYRKLSERGDLPWEYTHLFLVDERFVPEGHQDSNWRMIRETLIGKIEIPPENCHPIPVDAPTVDDSAARYQESLKSFFKTGYGVFPRFDLVVLGIGEDGHTASLFPATAALKVRDKIAVPVSRVSGVLHERITLTLPVLNNAGYVIFIAAGARKAPIVRRVLEREDESLPAVLVAPHRGSLLFVLDKAAAGAET